MVADHPEALIKEQFMYYYKVDFRNNFKEHSLITSGITEWSARDRVRNKFPGSYITKVTQIDKHRLSYDKKRKLEEAIKQSDDFFNGAVVGGIAEAVIDSMSSFSSDSGGSSSSVFDTVSDFASSVADSFDGGGSSSSFDD
jgi:hypothetical protein